VAAAEVARIGLLQVVAAEPVDVSDHDGVGATGGDVGAHPLVLRADRAGVGADAVVAVHADQLPAAPGDVLLGAAELLIHALARVVGVVVGDPAVDDGTSDVGEDVS
jgi:hypothetical protein